MFDIRESLETLVAGTVIVGVVWKVAQTQIDVNITRAVNGFSALLTPRLTDIEARVNRIEHYVNTNSNELHHIKKALKQLDDVDKRLDAIAINVGQSISINEAHRIVNTHADGAGHEATIRRLNSVEKDITDLRARMKVDARPTYTPDIYE